MAEINTLITRQEELSAAITSLYDNFKKANRDTRTKIFLKIREQRLQELYTKFSNYHEEISTTMHASERKTCSYWKTNIFGTAEETYWNMKTKIEEWREDLEAQNIEAANMDALNNTIANPADTVRRSEVRLPRVNIQVFNGECRKWTSFKNIFSSLIHVKTDLSKIEKFYFLKQHTSGDALRLIDHYSISEENYDTAWDSLVKRYDNQRLLIEAEIGTLLDYPTMVTESAYQVRKLVDTIQECLNTLKNLKIDCSTWDPILICILQRKLHKDTCYHWETSLTTSREIPTIKKLTEFLEGRFQILENLHGNRSNTVFTTNFNKSAPTQQNNRFTPNPFVKSKQQFQRNSNTGNNKSIQLTAHRSFHTTIPTSSSVNCFICQGNHGFSKCPQFCSSNAEKRGEIVRRLNRCRNCLKNHSEEECSSPSRCKICKLRHNTLLHPEQPSRENQQNEKQSTSSYFARNTHNSLLHPAQTSNMNQQHQQNDIQQSTSSYFANNTSSKNLIQKNQILLATALVTVASNGINHRLRCLLDQGSQSSFITEDAVQFLKLQKTSIIAHISGLSSASPEISKSMVTFNINSIYDSTFNLPIEALVLPKITNELPANFIKKDSWSHVRGLKLADPNYKTPNRIDILLGADVYGSIIQEGVKKGASDEPIAQNTYLGWMISGQTGNGAEIIKLTSMHQRIDIDSQLQKFWDQEEGPTVKSWTPEELRCEEHYKNNTTRNEDGRYIVALPFRDTENRKPLGKSKYRALLRLLNLEKKLERNQDLKLQYTEVLEEYMDLGHLITASDNNEDEKELYYLPHHAVIKESSSTTKLRVVFDASAKTKSNESLNDQLLIGPTIQQDLSIILMRWRRHQISLSADIAKMYRQIKLREEDQDFQRILWRKNNQIQDLKLTTVTFGNASAPFLAIRTLHQLASDYFEKYPEAAEIVKRDFYVDDLLTGADNIYEAKKLQNDVTNLLSEGGFELRRWISNSTEILQEIPESAREISLPLSIESEATTKTLGIHYHPHGDIFKFKINLIEVTGPPTKRSLLSETARLFDPLGWLGPVIIKAKIFFQELWKRKMSWDDKLDPELTEAWLKLRGQLKCLEDIQIPRWIKTSMNHQSIQLHGFSDASEKAYAAVIFLRIQNTDGSVHMSIITSKTRVAPIKLTSIPRLELCAAVLLSTLLEKTYSAMNMDNIEVYGWTDSKIVLAWLNKQPSNWKPFVAHRVAQIQEIKNIKGWNYIATTDNPADCASRGIYPNELQNFSLWWEGPKFLKNSEFSWPSNLDVNDTKMEEKINKNEIISMVQIKHMDRLEIIEKYSSLRKLLRIIATCIRFRHNCQHKQTKRTGALLVTELKEAETRCIRLVQTFEFSAEITALKTKKEVQTTSRISSFWPFLDNADIIRVGGRLQMANIPYEKKHPVILPANSNFTRLLINDAHVRCEHGGTQATVSVLRQRFWVLKSRNTVRHHINKCHTCFKFRQANNTQLMGALPANRLIAVRPFTNVGVDYAGPIEIKASVLRTNKSTKGYISLFVCFSTKAVHIEAVTDLTTNAFLAAFTRFVARRGKPANIYSDNGTNFVGASRELKKLFKNNQETTISDHLADQGIQWHFIPARAPHFGGLWEAGIRSVKTHLNRIISNTLLTYEELSTVLAQIEACLNSRPLQPFTEDINDYTFLTPGHFLIGSELNAPPAANFLDVPWNRVKRWQHLQKIQQHFWKRWSNEYITSLQQRYKWNEIKNNSKKGDMVLVKEDNVPPMKWKLARIEELHPGNDGHVRVVTIRTPNGIMKRCIAKLCPLPNQDI